MIGLGASDRVKGINFSKIRETTNKAKKMKNEGFDVIEFSQGRPDFDTPQHIIDATEEAFKKGMVHYDLSAGTQALREAIAYRIKEDFQLEVGIDEIIVTVGASEANYLATQTLLNPGDEVLIPDPMYVYYKGWSFLGGAKDISVPLDIILEQPENLENYITDRTKLIILTSPHNPTGQVISRNSLEVIAGLAKKYNFFVISDDIYNKMIYQEDINYISIANLKDMRERTFIIGSLSKTYAMDGWRVGYLIGPKNIIREALKMHQHILSCPNTFVQEGARIALTSSQDCVEEMVKEFGRRRMLMMSYFDQMEIPYKPPQGAFYIFPSIKKFGMDSEKFCEYLLNEAKVAIVPGNAFGKLGEGYARFSYTTNYKTIEKGMERIKTALEKL
ncbi:MAG TPA: pyridoxal phosphate-dependent aminotransferase [Candidatus Atribacteria bacterium]|nr:pyridoxal phosphate-dependent aminotransferase [Candidatus Atribacteria bacterium]